LLRNSPQRGEKGLAEDSLLTDEGKLVERFSSQMRGRLVKKFSSERRERFG